MKIARFFAAVALLTAAAFCVSAQQKPTATPAAPQAAAPQTNVAVPGQQDGDDLFGHVSRSEDGNREIQ